MRTLIVAFCLMFAFFAGLKIGKKTPKKNITSEKQFPMRENKTFTLVLYAYNQDLWVEKSLRSIFEQEYEDYRIIFIDDGSNDDTFKTAQNFIIKNNQSSRTLLIRNDEKQGVFSCLNKTVQTLSDQEIVIPILAKDWLAHSKALARMNAAFQNPDVWGLKAGGITFPSYESSCEMEGFYAAVFKDPNLTKKTREAASLTPLLKNKAAHIQDVLLISNKAAP